MSSIIKKLKSVLRPSKKVVVNSETDKNNVNHTVGLLCTFFDELNKHIKSGDWRGKTQFNFQNVVSDLQGFYKNDLIRASKYESIKKSSRQVRYLKNLALALSDIQINDFNWLTDKFEIRNCEKFIKKLDKIKKRIKDIKNLNDEDLLKIVIDNQTTLNSLTSPIEKIIEFSKSCISKAKEITK